MLLAAASVFTFSPVALQNVLAVRLGRQSALTIAFQGRRLPDIQFDAPELIASLAPLRLFTMNALPGTPQERDRIDLCDTYLKGLAGPGGHTLGPESEAFDILVEKEIIKARNLFREAAGFSLYQLFDRIDLFGYLTFVIRPENQFGVARSEDERMLICEKATAHFFGICCSAASDMHTPMLERLFDAYACGLLPCGYNRNNDDIRLIAMPEIKTGWATVDDFGDHLLQIGSKEAEFVIEQLY